MVSVLTLPAGLTCLKDVAAGICKACFNSYSEINECIVTFIGTSERVEKRPRHLRVDTSGMHEAQK